MKAACAITCDESCIDGQRFDGLWDKRTCAAARSSANIWPRQMLVDYVRVYQQ